jgi:tetratricopeptide (TPR) repeat protein
MTLKSPSYYEITSLMQKGNLKHAMSMLATCESSMPKCEHLECLGNSCFYERKKQEAITHYESAMNMNPEYDCARYHYLLGVQLEMQGDNIGAYDRYNAAIVIEPTFVDSYIELGGLLVKVKDFELAAKVYEDALIIDPCDLRIYANLKQVYEMLYTFKGSEFKQKYDDALRSYEAAAKRLPSTPEGYQW